MKAHCISFHSRRWMRAAYAGDFPMLLLAPTSDLWGPAWRSIQSYMCTSDSAFLALKIVRFWQSKCVQKFCVLNVCTYSPLHSARSAPPHAPHSCPSEVWVIISTPQQQTRNLSKKRCGFWRMKVSTAAVQYTARFLFFWFGGHAASRKGSLCGDQVPCCCGAVLRWWGARERGVERSGGVVRGEIKHSIVSSYLFGPRCDSNRDLFMISNMSCLCLQTVKPCCALTVL